MRADLPNIVFFFTDDQRFDTLSALGNDDIVTPNLDRLAARGTLFTHAHIPCGTSGAVCMPSRAMLHSGRTLFHLSGAGQSIPAEHTTLGECLRAAGYRTFGAGKWHNGAESYHRSFSDGDEIFFGGMADHWNVPAFRYDPTGAYDGALPYVANWQTDNAVSHRRADHITPGVHSTDLIADAGLRFLESVAEETPFFMYLSFLAPHDPRTMPRRYLDLYDPDHIPLPRNFMGGHPFDTGALHIRDEQLAGFPRSPEDIRRHIAEYYAMITHVDDRIGDVMDALERRGLADNTLVVFAGDNGLALGQHGLMGKQNCYEHSVRVPLIFAGPGVPKGVRTEAFAYLFDIFPTLCDLSGVPIPGSVEGTSLLPVFRNPKTPVRDDLFFAYTDSQRAVKDRRHKLVEYVRGGRHIMTQLFDLRQDPLELDNLAGDPGHADTLERLRGVLRRRAGEWDDESSEWGQRFWAGYRED